jgi:CDP-glucose 4,6-dehydratase
VGGAAAIKIFMLYSIMQSRSHLNYNELDLDSHCESNIADVNDLRQITEVIKKSQPDFIFHMAAQPLVRYSYKNPIETFSTNVMGTANILEACKVLEKKCCVVCITTDKVYHNNEWLYPYRETDTLGGYDPYSSSKAAAELVIDSYRKSFFTNTNIFIATARAGNVIGGGDWALDRIVPDCIRALSKNDSIVVRNKVATRPWQHVLEPLSGYLWLGAQLSKGETQAPVLASGFNFGPSLSSNRSVADLVNEIIKHWPGQVDYQINPNAVHEAKLLSLAIDKSQHYLNWSPVWGFERTIAETAAWYLQNKESSQQGAAAAVAQIAAYTSDADAMSLPWSL